MTCSFPEKYFCMYSFFAFHLLIICTCRSTLSENDCVILVPGENFNNSKGHGTAELTVYCHPSSPKSLLYLWKSIYLELKMASSDYTLFDGENCSSVQQQYNEHISAWFFLPWQESTVSFPAFKQYCVGIYTSQKISLQFFIRSINFWKVLQTVIGICLFLCAENLSRNSFFHYTTGVSFGVLASFLVLVFILSKLIPKKPAAYTVLLFGISAVFYGIQMLYYNIKEVILNYSSAVITYISVSACISFIVCYRFGPVSNMKTLNLIQWFMQAFGVLLIFFSSEYREASTAMIITIISAYSIPASWIVRMKCLWCHYFPPKIKLLTEMEYIEQGNIETKKALENLRSYCSSPECKAWSTVKKLKDPVRFAQFIEGESHLTDAEILDYDALSIYPGMSQDLTDDESDRENYSSHQNNYQKFSHR